MDIIGVLRQIMGRRANRNVPDELKPYSCFVPDAGYCVLAIPKAFAEESKARPEDYVIPLPEKYVLEKGWTMLDGVPCVDVRYDSLLGAVVDEKYESWE